MKLSLIGIGIRGTSQITLSALESMKTADLILYHTGKEALFEEFIAKEVGGEHRCISSCYVDGAMDTENYTRIHDTLVAEFKSVNHIAFVVEGHPLVGVSVVKNLRKTCEFLGIEFSVVCGVSSFDTMIVDLAIDPLERGALTIDANRLILFSIPLIPEVETFIYHLGSVGTSVNDLSTPEITSCLSYLQNYLQKFYCSSHPVMLVESGETNKGVPLIVTATVESLSEVAFSLSNSSTLYIPARRPAMVNEEFLSRLSTASLPKASHYI